MIDITIQDLDLITSPSLLANGDIFHFQDLSDSYTDKVAALSAIAEFILRQKSIPSVGSEIVTDSATQTLTNKKLTSPKINSDTTITANGADINKLSGMTSTTAELNKLSGMTSTTAELNKLHGVTASTAEINKLSGMTSTTDELNKLSGMTSTTAELNKLSGMTSTTDELNKLHGVTASTTEINILDGASITTAELNKLHGVTASTAEFNYLTGVTSSIQTQINEIANQTQGVTNIIYHYSPGVISGVISQIINEATLRAEYGINSSYRVDPDSISVSVYKLESNRWYLLPPASSTGGSWEGIIFFTTTTAGPASQTVLNSIDVALSSSESYRIVVYYKVLALAGV